MFRVSHLVTHVEFKNNSFDYKRKAKYGLQGSRSLSDLESEEIKSIC
jgi:hypothetical protein